MCVYIYTYVVCPLACLADMYGNRVVCKVVSSKPFTFIYIYNIYIYI